MRPFQTNHAAIRYVFGLSYINNSNSHIPKTIDCLNLHFCIFHIHQFIEDDRIKRSVDEQDPAPVNVANIR